MFKDNNVTFFYGFVKISGVCFVFCIPGENGNEPVLIDFISFFGLSGAFLVFYIGIVIAIKQGQKAVPVPGNKGFTVFTASCAGKKHQQQTKGNMFNFESQKTSTTPIKAKLFSKLGNS
jgi:hypothetical protein